MKSWGKGVKERKGEKEQPMVDMRLLLPHKIQTTNNPTYTNPPSFQQAVAVSVLYQLPEINITINYLSFPREKKKMLPYRGSDKKLHHKKKIRIMPISPEKNSSPQLQHRK